MTTPSQTAAQRGQSPTDIEAVDAAIDSPLASHHPRSTPDVEFRGARFDAGLAWAQLPVGVGGLDLGRSLNRHIERRLRAAGATPPDPTTFFMSLAGPTIVAHGNTEQRNRFLRPMFTGEHRWCQLFSEPSAGSDLAGLACRAVRDGDEWVVNGRKVWNTLAHVSDWGMLVTRSHPGLPKHHGMTYFAVDMRSAGVEVRPLRQITGDAEFNEVYLTDVRIPDANRIGPEGEGWRVAMTTLMNERTAIGGGAGTGGGKARRGGAANDAVAVWQGLADDQRTVVRRDQLIRLWIRGEVGRLTNMRAAQTSQSGSTGPVGAVAKLEYAAFNQALYAFCIDPLGPSGQVDCDYTYSRPDELDATWVDRGLPYVFLRVRGNSIEGGTSEILRNVLGEQLLGLPGEPRSDKDLPWAHVPRN